VLKRVQGIRDARQCHGLAVGVIIGAAFGKIVTSLVEECAYAANRATGWQGRFCRIVSSIWAAGISIRLRRQAAPRRGHA